MTDEDPWGQLVQAGKVAPPDPAVFGRAREQFLRAAAELDGEQQPAGGWRRRGPVLGGVAAAVIAVGLVAQVAGTGGGDPRPTADPSPGAASHQSPPAEPPAPTVTLAGGTSSTGSLVAYFGAPTFRDFTRTEYVADVVEGVVVDSTSRVIRGRDDASIVTELDLRVERSRSGRQPGSMITVFQPGGVVPKTAVRRQLEDKFGPLTAEELEGFVEELGLNGQAPSKAGDTVLIALGADFVKPEGMSVATLTEISDGIFTWRVRPPNKRWPEEISEEQVDELFVE